MDDAEGGVIAALLTDSEVPVADGAFQITIERWGVAVVHCVER